ncbi:MAG: rRNA maturation RNase YbeY [Planctomycetes bacterium]|jgi:probable rRNA maturation factor|nr:rRNA maturation RNase YbeY [Planctomycetota bacterium]
MIRSENELNICNKTKITIPTVLLKQAFVYFLKDYRRLNYSLSLVFVGDVKMREWNRIYRGYDKSTDVLSFPSFLAQKKNKFSVELGLEKELGEIIINPVQIKRQAKKNSALLRKEDFQKELLFIFVHGLLHLVGYDDETEKGRIKMLAEGKKFLKKYFSDFSYSSNKYDY